MKERVSRWRGVDSKLADRPELSDTTNGLMGTTLQCPIPVVSSDYLPKCATSVWTAGLTWLKSSRIHFHLTVVG